MTNTTQCPLSTSPFPSTIETRYITRANSLGVRLAANISAGHLLLTILSKFTLDIILRILPITTLFLIILLVIMVASDGSSTKYLGCAMPSKRQASRS